MGRLIDASELIEIIKGNENLIELQKEELIECVNACDTAYDVDAVVERLDRASDYYECNEQGREHVQMVDLTESIEIVKGGGVNAGYTSGNSDDITMAVAGLDVFTKNWCMNCGETKKQDDMGRLTKTYSDGTHGAAENLPCGENSYTYKGLLIDKLGKYEDMEEQGQLLKLPCNIGDSIYLLKGGNQIIEADIYEIHIMMSKRIVFIVVTSVDTPNGCRANINEFCQDDIGESVFLTRSEAEAKLKELEEK